MRSIRKTLVAGILTLIPLWITWIVCRFTFVTLSDLGVPWVRALARYFEGKTPWASELLSRSSTQQVFAFLLTLLVIYFLGFAATRVVGARIISAFEKIISRIPIVQTVYGSTKKLLESLQSSPGNTQRVVLIDFPNDSMKTIGLVTKTFTDAATGAELAAVYVPTTPNPTSGYLEIVPTKRLTQTDMTMDEAMTFIISGGAVSPDVLPFFPKENEKIK